MLTYRQRIVQGHRAFTHPKKRGLLEHAAKQWGVSPEHLAEIVKRRKLARLNRIWRRKDRQRAVDAALANGRNPKKGKPKLKPDERYAGEGDFDVLLRMANMKKEEFADLAGMHVRTVYAWDGHPVYNWPIALLKTLIANRRMAEVLEARGIDAKQFEIKDSEIPTKVSTRNWHPRTGKDLVKVFGDESKPE